MAVTLPRQSYEMLHTVSVMNDRDSDTELERCEDRSMDNIKSCEGAESLKRPRETVDTGSSEECGENLGDAGNDSEPATKVFRASIIGGKLAGGGGGRRKQSKPLRMCNEVLLPTGDVPPPEKTEENENRSEDLLPEDADMDEVENKADANQSCALCDENFVSAVELEDHVRSVHDLRRDESGDVDGEDGVYPTKYHQRGRELQDGGALEHLQREDSTEVMNLKNPARRGSTESDDREEGIRRDWMKDQNNLDDMRYSEGGLNLSFKNSLYSKSESDLKNSMESMDPNLINGEPWDPNNKNRIFHPDAYCEICDREFCNKYFLKTHKANKHGIYDGSNGPPSSNGSAANTPNLERSEQAPSLTPALNPPTTPNGMFSIVSLLQQQQQQQQLQLQKDFSMPSSMPGLPFSRPSLSLQTPKSSSGLSGIPNPTSPVAAAAMASLTGTPGLSSTDFNSALESSLGGAKPLAPDMEDYCEFCQKHFCNKYYLRKHKLDVHGINTSSATLSDTKRHLPPVSSVGHDPATQRSGTPMKTSGGGVTSASSLPYLHNMANLMLLNPFAAAAAAAAANAGGNGFPPSALPPILPGSIPGFPVSGANGLSFPPLSLPGDLKKEKSSSQETGSSGPDAPRMPSEVLQSLGILNAEAYMEMCRKEMFNGLLPGAGLNAVDSKKSLFPASNLLGFGAFGGQNSIPPVKREPMSDKIDSAEMFRNALFGLSPFNAKMESSGNNLANELMHLDKLNSLNCLSNQGAYDKNIFGNMAAAKLVDRVVCDICNKEVCNKYFLKTHKIKVHGCDPNSLDTAGQERTPGKQSENRSGPTPTLHNPDQAAPPREQSFSERLRNDDLARKGYDPEAFCDICQKEFSSKYFLKTHKQNIHNIKSDQSFPESSSLTDSILGHPASISSMFGAYPSLDSLSGGGCLPTPIGPPTQSPQLNGSPSLASQRLNFLASGMFGMPPNLNSDSSSSHDGSEKSRSSMQKDSPGYSSRVVCKVCSKELCNKYFLRTHLAKCHGITSPDEMRSDDQKDDIDGNDCNSQDANSAHGSDEERTGFGVNGISKSLESISNGYLPMNLAIGQKAPSTYGSFYESASNRWTSPGKDYSDRVSRETRDESEEKGFDFKNSKVQNNNDLRNSSEDDEGRFSSHSDLSTRLAVVNHIRNQQNRRSSASCEFCSEHFASQGDYDEHVSREHPEKSHHRLDKERSESPRDEDRARDDASRFNGRNDDDNDSDDKVRHHHQNEGRLTNGFNSSDSHHQIKNYSSQRNTEESQSGRTSPRSPSEAVCYARPVSEPLEGVTMQMFRMTEVEEEGDGCSSETTWKRTFATALVCLPTLNKVTEQLSVTFTLTPVSRSS